MAQIGFSNQVLSQLSSLRHTRQTPANFSGYVIEHMFDGERDLEQLYKGALDHLRRVGGAQTG